MQLQPRGVVAAHDPSWIFVHRQQARPLLGLPDRSAAAPLPLCQVLVGSTSRTRSNAFCALSWLDSCGLGDLARPAGTGRSCVAELLDALRQGQQHLAQLVPLRLLAVQRLQLVVLTGLAVQLAQGAHRLLVRRLQPHDLAIDLDGLRGGKQLLGQQRADALEVRDLVFDVFGARPLPRDDLDQRWPPLLTIV
jgi:hypothetical protein